MREPNRRKETRARTSIRFWYRMPWSRVWHAARTKDISLGGLSFELPSGLCFKGLPIEVAVDVPSAAFRSRTHVVRTRSEEEAGRTVAVRFKNLPTHLRDKMRSFVDRFASSDNNGPAKMVFAI